MPSSATREIDVAAAGRGQREQPALGHELADDAAPRRAERQADADLALTRHAARQQQVGDVGAADQQDQAEGEEQRREDRDGFHGLRKRASPRQQHDGLGRGDRRPRPAGSQSHAAICARALSIDTPGLRRPMISTPTLSSRPRSPGRNCASCGSGAQKSGCADLEAAEPRRHHADDLERRAADEHGPSQHVRIAVEVAGPAPVAQHDDRIAARLVVGGREGASHHGIDADDLEEVAGDQRHRHHPAIDAEIDVGQRRIGVGEDAGLPAQGLELRARERRSIAVGQPRPFDGVHLG